MGGMLYPFSPRQGLVMAGDALGHVQARGGSGIKTSFLIGYTAGSLAADVMRSGGWTQGNRKKFEKTIKYNPHVRSLRLHNLIFFQSQDSDLSMHHQPGRYGQEMAHIADCIEITVFGLR